MAKDHRDETTIIPPGGDETRATGAEGAADPNPRALGELLTILAELVDHREEIRYAAFGKLTSGFGYVPDDERLLTALLQDETSVAHQAAVRWIVASWPRARKAVSVWQELAFLIQDSPGGRAIVSTGAAKEGPMKESDQYPNERTISLDCPPETERLLQERAARAGRTVAQYVRDLIERDLHGGAAEAPTELDEDERPWRGVLILPRPRYVLFTPELDIESGRLPQREPVVNMGWHRSAPDDD
jgi:hypothetical protein